MDKLILLDFHKITPVAVVQGSMNKIYVRARLIISGKDESTHMKQQIRIKTLPTPINNHEALSKLCTQQTNCFLAIINSDKDTMVISAQIMAAMVTTYIVAIVFLLAEIHDPQNNSEMTTFKYIMM